MKKRTLRIQFTRRQLNALRRADFTNLLGVTPSVLEYVKDTLARHWKTGKETVRVSLSFSPAEVKEIKKWAVDYAIGVKPKNAPTPLYIALVKLGAHAMRGGR